jgi:plastocyanin
VALPQLIDINPGPKGAQFVPATLDVVAGDVITWANNDPKHAHWPALTAQQTGTSKIPVSPADKLYFMPNQIAAGTSSSEFRPGDTVTTTLYYACFNHPQEVGQIVVTPAGQNDAG